MVHVPMLIETDRLVLRPLRQDDAVAVHQALCESIGELRQFLWFLPWVSEEPTLESARTRCQKAEADIIARRDLSYLAFTKQGGQLVGSIGLHRTDWLLPKTEIGYWMRMSAAGNGYASEGVQALTNWAINELHALRVELITDEANIASRKVAERCGFRLEGILRNVERRPDGSV